jgi:hypothetical protein
MRSACDRLVGRQNAHFCFRVRAMATDGNLGFPGGSSFDGSYDGSINLISSFSRDLVAYKSERADVATCAFALPGASGHPKRFR